MQLSGSRSLGAPCCSDVDDYVGAASVANLAITRSPIAIVYVRSVEAVQGAVNCSREAGFPAVARSGGHSYEGELLLSFCVAGPASLRLHCTAVAPEGGWSSGWRLHTAR